MFRLVLHSIVFILIIFKSFSLASNPTLSILVLSKPFIFVQHTHYTISSMFFTLIVLALALFWATIGVMLARWLKQAGYAKPLKFKGKELNLYGAGTGFGRRTEWGERDDGRVLATGGRDVGIAGFGEGRVKGL
jgi:hypothetical protein